MNTSPHCSHCGKPITEGEQWEYTKGAYSISTPESQKQRIHSHCVTELLQQTLAAFAQVRKDKQDQIYFDI